MTGRRGAPESKLTEALQATLCERLTAGATIEDACEAVGIPSRRYRDWMRRGDGDQAPEPFAGFRAAVLKARAEARRHVIDARQRAAAAAGLDDEQAREQRLLSFVERAAEEGSWQASKWLLERGYPERYAPRRAEPASKADAGGSLPDNVTQLRPDAHGGF